MQFHVFYPNVFACIYLHFSVEFWEFQHQWVENPVHVRKIENTRDCTLNYNMQMDNKSDMIVYNCYKVFSICILSFSVLSRDINDFSSFQLKRSLEFIVLFVCAWAGPKLIARFIIFSWCGPLKWSRCCLLPISPPPPALCVAGIAFRRKRVGGKKGERMRYSCYLSSSYVKIFSLFLSYFSCHFICLFRRQPLSQPSRQPLV